MQDRLTVVGFYADTMQQVVLHYWERSVEEAVRRAKGIHPAIHVVAVFPGHLDDLMNSKSTVSQVVGACA